MRSFEDEDGRVWDVVAGRESWGAVFAIFIPRRGSSDDATGERGETGPRQTPLQATGYAQANRELENLDDDGLRQLLARSDPKTIG